MGMVGSDQVGLFRVGSGSQCPCVLQYNSARRLQPDSLAFLYREETELLCLTHREHKTLTRPPVYSSCPPPKDHAASATSHRTLHVVWLQRLRLGRGAQSCLDPIAEEEELAR